MNKTFEGTNGPKGGQVVALKLNSKGTFGTLNGDYDRNCNLYY